MPRERPLKNRVKDYRQQRGWSQDQLAQRAGISRAAVSAIEIERLSPSVATALSLAAAFGCRVEDLFGPLKSAAAADWAWLPDGPSCRFWLAQSGGANRYYPVEPTAAGVVAHDGVFTNGAWRLHHTAAPEKSLVMACCDPAAALLAAAVAQSGGFRLLLLQRSSRQALDLLSRGLVDVAGIHLASARKPQQNADAVRCLPGDGYCLLTMARWQEVVAVSPRAPRSSIRAVVRAGLAWVGREPGSGAQQCLEELLQGRPFPRRLAKDHRGVAEAIRCGWADAGVCHRLVSEEAGLRFFRLRDEVYDLVYPRSLSDDPRIVALRDVVRSRVFRGTLGELPGYDSSPAGEVLEVTG